MLRVIHIVFSIMISISVSHAQDEIQWLTWEEMQVMQKREARKVLIDVYTDWCGWCKRMDKAVFADPQWAEFAKKELSLAYIDFPQNKKLVPAKFVEQNAVLKTSFEIKGYPSYVVIKPDGKTILENWIKSI